MALVFMDGFDANDITVKWNNVNGTWLTTTATRFGSGAASICNGVSGQTFRSIPAANKVYVGFAVNVTNLNSRVPISLYGDGGTVSHITILTNTDGSLTLRRGITGVMTTAAGVLKVNTWCYMEVSAVIADTGGTVTVKVDGVTAIDFTGDTKNGGTNTTVDAVYIGQSSNVIYDDLYICDDTGPAPYNTFLGDTRVVTMSPSGAGASTQLTPDSGSNYARVNEMPYSAANNVTGTTPGQRDTYTLSDLPFGVTQIFAVQNNVIAKKTSTGAIALKPAIKSGTNVYYGATTIAGTNDATTSDLRTTDPNTSVAWTVSGVNSLEAGLEIA